MFALAVLLLTAQLVRPELTPGAIRPLTPAQVCAIKWGKDVRHVTPHMKDIVFRAYGVPDEDRHLYRVDHLIPRELAGADVVANLWPEIIAAADIKDITENALHRAVCAQTVTLEDAQEQMRGWGKP